ncbi:MAG TPA: hypothetical protein VNM14_22230 [Planctomycetota bacterium]|nr:hypothetical protein [Planctomycetota bacterium]
MESDALKTRLDELTKSLAAIEVSSAMHTDVRSGIASKLDAIAADAERDVVPALGPSPDPDLHDAAARVFRQLAMTNSWLENREERTRNWIDRAAELVRSDILRDLIKNEQNRLRDGEAFAGISDLCEKGLVDKARRELVRRRKASSDPVLRKRIEEVLADPRNFLSPMRSAPGLMTMNGFGTMMWGERDRKADGTYVSTLCMVFCFLPFLPLRSYLVSREGTGWRFYGRVPLSPFAFWYRRIAVLGPILAALVFWGYESTMSLPYVTETRALATAGEQKARRDYAAAMNTLGKISTRDAERGAQVQQLVQQTLTSALSDVQTLDSAQRFLGTTGAACLRTRRALGPDGAAAAQAALGRFAVDPGAGKTARDFVTWMAGVFPDVRPRQAEILEQACRSCDSPLLLAAAAEQYFQSKRPCPADLVRKLRTHLLERRHDTWDADVLSYLKVADASDARPLLYARVESAWKGDAAAPDLLDLPQLPAPFRKLLELDLEKNPEKQVAGLEKAVEVDGLEDAQKTWQRIGVAKRLVKILGVLNEKDPIRTPVSKIRPWAVQASELAPDDVAARVLALRYLLEEGDYARVIEMGRPGTADRKTATFVGVALARSGKTEEAATLLRPIVSRDLPEFLLAFQNWERAAENKSQWLWNTLKQGTADRSFIGRLNAMPKEQAMQEAERWVQRQVDLDASVASLRTKWRERVDVHPAASELAMIELSLGRSMPPGAERQARLEAAERLFLDLRKILQGNPHQELQLGQVYFWLGKEKEGTDIFGKLEEGGDPKILHALGEAYRSFYRQDDARRVLEKAYEKSSANDRMTVAFTRSITTNDMEDRLAWLQKADVSSPAVKVEIDTTQAYLSMESGNFAAAVAPLQRAAAYYQGRPESSTTLNNGAIVENQLAAASGDFKHLVEALGKFRKAKELEPESAILLGNYLSGLERVGHAALAGDALRPDLLHELPTSRWQDYVVPQPTREQWAARTSAQPELRRAADLVAKCLILSPDNESGYTAQSEFLIATRDLAGLRRLREAVEANPPKRSEDAAKDRAHDRGEYTPSERNAALRALEHLDERLAELRKAGHARSLAFALVRSSWTRLNSLRRGLGDQKIERVVREVEEAVTVFDARPTRSALAQIRMQQAALAFAATDEAFGRWVKDNPGVALGHLLVLYARKHPDLAPAIREREDVKQAARAADEALRIDPTRASLSLWTWLDMAGHASREDARKAYRDDPLLLEEARLDRLLNAGSAEKAVEAWLAATACGETEVAASIAAQARSAGLLPAFFTP